MVLKEFEVRLVRRVPSTLEFGVLYVCFECNVVVHLCACGCGEKVVLPINPHYWSVKYDGEHMSLFPSVGNFQFNCKSHYWIRDNRIVWVKDNDKETDYLTRNDKKSTIFQLIVNWIKRIFS